MKLPFSASAISRQDGSSADGIHLLWTPPLGVGYSIDGFDIQRRESAPRNANCYTLSDNELETLRQVLRLTIPSASIHLRLVDCPEFPQEVPDEPIEVDPNLAQGRLFADFQRQAAGPAPNPRVERIGILRVSDRSGQDAARTGVRRIGLYQGLDCGFRLAIALVTPVDEIEATLVYFAAPPTVEAWSGESWQAAPVSPDSVRGQPHTVHLEGKGIDRVVITSAQAETLLLWISAVAVGDTLTAMEGRPSRLQRPSFGFRRTKATAGDTTGPPPLEGCVAYDIRFDDPQESVLISAKISGVLAIALRSGKAVATRLSTNASGTQNLLFVNRIVDRVLLYAEELATSLIVCTTEPVPDAAWSGVPFVAQHVHVPIRAVNPALNSEAAEQALASSRLLSDEAFDAEEFADVAALMNQTAVHAEQVSPTTQLVVVRDDLKDPFLEIRGWPYALAMLVQPSWRRMLGFGLLDRGSGLTPGTVYDYRITGRFRRRDLHETLYGFQTVPLDTALPRTFRLGPVLVETSLPAQVAMLPLPSPNVLRAAGRKGIALQPVVAGDRSATLSFPMPVTSVVLELEPGPSADLRFEARTSGFLIDLSGIVFSGSVPAQRRAVITFDEPVDRLTLFGSGFLYGVRVPADAATGQPEDVIPFSVVIFGVRYEPTTPPAAPPMLGTTHLQRRPPSDTSQITRPEPPQNLGFRLFWQAPPAAGTAITPWPNDLAVFPPFDVVGFRLERRRLDTGEPFEDIADEGVPITFFGNRSSRHRPIQLRPGVDLVDVFPEEVKARAPISAFMEAEDTLLSPSKTDGPPPGSLFQYRISSIDAIGRRSAVPTLGSVVRLEKHTPPPQPVGPASSDDDAPRALGVTARVLQTLDPHLTPADRELLGDSANAIVLEWGWTEAERIRDPFATEFRMYFRDVPPDVVRGSVAGTAAKTEGIWQMAASWNQPLREDALRGQYLRTPSGLFKVQSHPAGQDVTIQFESSELDPARAPIGGEIETSVMLDPVELRPNRWPERTAVLSITAEERYLFVFRDRLSLSATQPDVRAWVGVTAADSQTYVPDEIPDGHLNGRRPGNESSIAAAPVHARFLGRPAFEAPLPLADVPEQVASEPIGDRATALLELPVLLPTVIVPTGSRVTLERLGADALLNRLSARDDDTIGARFPDGTIGSYELDDPDDHATFLSQIRSGEGARVAGKFLLDFVVRHVVLLESLWQSSSASEPFPFGPVEDTLPGNAERYLHRIRLVDDAGHRSAGAAILPQFVRVPTLAAPAAPAFELPASRTDTLTMTARVRDVFDLRWLLLFMVVGDSAASLEDRQLETPQLLRLPNRRDLYPDGGVALRLADGEQLAPAMAIEVTAGELHRPDRVLTVPLAVGFEKRATVWAVAMTRDGIVSPLAGPRTAFSGPAPLTVPALTVHAGSTFDTASWEPVAVHAEASVERSTDGGATWSRATRWFRPSEQDAELQVITRERQYRLALRASQGRRATGPPVIPE